MPASGRDEALVEEVRSTVRELLGAAGKDDGLVLPRAWKMCVRRVFARLLLEDEYRRVCDPIAEKIFAAWSIIWLPANRDEKRVYTLIGSSTANMLEVEDLQRKIIQDVQNAMLELPYLPVQECGRILDKLLVISKEIVRDDKVIARGAVTIGGAYFAYMVERLTFLLTAMLTVELAIEFAERERVITRTLREYLSGKVS